MAQINPQGRMVDNIFRRRIADVLQALVVAGLIGGYALMREMVVAQNEMSIKIAVMSAQITVLNDQYRVIAERVTTGAFSADQRLELTRRVAELESALKSHMNIGVHVDADRRITIIERDLQQIRGGKDH